MDIVLKGDMDGIEAAGQIRDRFDIPVVYLTAYIDEERLEKTKFTEPYGYLIKPFEDTELRLAIEMALQRHKLEIALRNAEENWRISFNSLDDIMLIIDRDYTIENINAKGLKLLGKSKEEVIGKKCYQAISGVDSPIKECPCMKSMETKKVESLDWYNTRFGKYFSIKSSPIFDEKGKIVKFIDLMRDITERKQAEDALHESEEMARALLNASFDSVLLLDTDGTILALNESAARRIGMSAVKLIGLCCFDLFPTEIAERRKACNDKVIRSGKPINFTDQRGGFLFNTMIYPVFDTEGKVTRLAVFVHDITEQVWSEEQIKASLMEKEVLIKEIHQRVKNNLQVVSSLLNMQARTTENKDAFAILSESRGMINAMGLIHSQLYEGEDLSKINMKRFMDKLMEQLFQIYSVPETRISPVIHAVECSLPISIAVPVGLIVNEVLTNSKSQKISNIKIPMTKTKRF
jgi:PAS domain S-box-containing protein